MINIICFGKCEQLDISIGTVTVILNFYKQIQV